MDLHRIIIKTSNQMGLLKTKIRISLTKKKSHGVCVCVHTMHVYLFTYLCVNIMHAYQHSYVCALGSCGYVSGKLWTKEIQKPSHK